MSKLSKKNGARFLLVQLDPWNFVTTVTLDFYHNMTIKIPQKYFLMFEFFKIEPAFDFDAILKRELQTKCAKVAPFL